MMLDRYRPECMVRSKSAVPLFKRVNVYRHVADITVFWNLPVGIIHELIMTLVAVGMVLKIVLKSPITLICRKTPVNINRVNSVYV
jgi:hypothetical protein